MIHTRETILAILREGPTKYRTLTECREGNPETRALIAAMKAEGLIKGQYIDRFPYLVLAGWKHSTEERAKVLESNARPTVDGCLIWKGCMDEKKGPVARDGDSHWVRPVARMLWELRKGEIGQFSSVKPTCGNEGCIAIAHLEKVQRNEHHKGRKRDPSKRQNIAEGARRGFAKLTMEIAREIRASTESGPKLALKYGVTKHCISDIRSGNTWKEYQQGLFTGLIDARKRA